MPEATGYDIWALLGGILLILALAGVIIPVLQRIRVSSVLGYLLCGLLIGSHALGLLVDDIPWLHNFVITDEKLIAIFAELGIVFLLFVIGLELTFSRLWELRKLVLGLGSTQILVTACVIVLVALQFGNSLPSSILIGSALALSSTAIVMQMLMERHMISRPVGRICFSVLLMQDLAVVPILVLAGVFSGDAEGGTFVLLFKALLMAAIVIVSMFAAGKLLLRPLLHFTSPTKNAEWLLAMTLFLIIGAASVTHFAGLSAALGAFLAGLLVSETEYKHEIEVITEPVKGLLMGVFFLSVGMATDIAEILAHPFWLLLSVVGIFVIKVLIFYPLARLFSVPKGQAAQAAVMLAQSGEFAFIIIGISLAGGLLLPQDAHFFQLVVAVSLLFTPLTGRLATFAKNVMGRHDEKDTAILPVACDVKNSVIIAGFGRVGKTMADILESQAIPYIGIDSSGAHVATLRKLGYPVIYGNARHIELWRKLDAGNARAAVITIDEFTATDDILRALRKQWPILPVIIRVKDTSGIAQYYEHGATAVVPEALESTLHLVRTLLEHSGMAAEEAGDVIAHYRHQALLGERQEIKVS